MTHNDDTFDDLSESPFDQDVSPADALDDTAVLKLRRDVSSTYEGDHQSTGAIPAFLANVAYANADGSDVAGTPVTGYEPAHQDTAAIPDFLRHPDASRGLDAGTAWEPASAGQAFEEDSMAGLDTFADEGVYLFEDTFVDAYAKGEARDETVGEVSQGDDFSEGGPDTVGARLEEEAYHGQEPGDVTVEDQEASASPDMGAFVASAVWRESTLAWDTPIDSLSATGEFGVYVSSSEADEAQDASLNTPVAHEDDHADPWPDRLLWPDEETGEIHADVVEGTAEVDGADRMPSEEGQDTVRDGWEQSVPGTDIADEVAQDASAESMERFEVLHGVPANEDFDQYDASDEYDAYEDPADPVDAGGEGQDEGEGTSFVAGAHEAVVTKDRSGLKRGLQIAGVVVLVLALLVGGYFIGLNQFKGRFLARTTINGLDVSGLTPTEAVAALEEETANYACTVNVGDYAGAFTGRDYALERNEQHMADVAFSMVDVRLWPIRYLFAQNIFVDPALTFDEAQLRDYVMHSVDDHNTLALPTAGARIHLDEGTGLYSVEGTTSGTAVAKEPVSDAVVASVTAFESVCTPDPEACLHEATVQDLPAYAYSAVRANLDRTSEIPIFVNGVQVAVLTPEQSREWVTVDDTPEVVVDTESLRDWATYVVADAVWHRDDWSNYYLDLDAFVAGLTDRLKLGIVEGYEAPCYEELRTEGESRTLAYERGGWNSELGRYIDVDLEAQFVRLFDETGNVIWESACVSGDLYESRSTVTGVFEIYSKQMGVTLVGLDYNNDGSPDYESYVNFWMPFYGGYGLHDATWRANFGGDYFYYNGSHGCINLPYSKAEELYNMTFVGEKVNVHW